MTERAVPVRPEILMVVSAPSVVALVPVREITAAPVPDAVKLVRVLEAKPLPVLSWETEAAAVSAIVTAIFSTPFAVSTPMMYGMPFVKATPPLPKATFRVSAAPVVEPVAVTALNAC